ncbi:GNAT family N-acetyltransferase [Streptomyces sp. NBC_00654]|uniref:GNAT family N-acetyltransferase n=1 Tax=Streptomyces sp. NBC_00654 TaxID=2975799 RepID=UPI0022534AB4|nr:GNAT family N-acetyltransferase [Streptomyces sp. NBC_00654]MCX4970627.1 GNAT family N-acetyltransferase [Streptomyces sp. NBC_00654]
MLTTEEFEVRESGPEELAAWCRVFADGQAELSGVATEPGAPAERLRAGPGDGVRRWAAREAGRICAVADLRPQRHDPAVGFLRLTVAPRARCRGTGAALLARIAAEAGDRGTERIQALVPAGTPGQRFVRRWRVMLRLELHEQRLDRDVLRRCHELAADPHPGYRVVSWQRAAPAEWAPSFGRVMGHVLDAPGAELQMASRAWDTAAVRAWEAEMAGRRLLVSAVVHLPSCEVVGATVATVADTGARAADQHDTAVLPGHRSGGLARWMKARHTLRLHELFPEAGSVTVTVNRENAPMLAVNRMIGYRLVRERLLVETPTAGIPTAGIPTGGTGPNG